MAGTNSGGAASPCGAAEGSLRPSSLGRGFPLSSPGGCGDWKKVPLDGACGSYGSVFPGVFIRRDSVFAITVAGKDCSGDAEALSCFGGSREGSFEASILDNVGRDIRCTTTYCGLSASVGYYGGLP